MADYNKARRRLLAGIGAGLTAATAGVIPGLRGWAHGQALRPTPACADEDEPTPAQTAGPFFTPNSPRRNNFRDSGATGTPIVLEGLVLTRACQPVPGALVDLWHADAGGEYDNEGYRMRGHQFTDSAGHYRFETVVPGLYPGRTRHFHIRYQAASRDVLTTQLYFPGEPGNARDRIFRPELVLTVTGETARFDAVLDMA